MRQLLAPIASHGWGVWLQVDDIEGFDAYVLPFGSYALGFRVKRLAFDFFDFLVRPAILCITSMLLFARLLQVLARNSSPPIWLKA